MKQLLLVIAVFTGYFSFGQVPVSGTYNKSTVKIYRDEQNKMIYGNFNSCASAGKMCCSFNFKGHYKTLKDKKIALETSWPDDSEKIKGWLIGNADSGFTVKLNQMPPGATACSNMDKDGYTAKLTQQRKWTGLSMIKTSKTYLYAQPDNNKRMNAFLLMYDVVAVLAVKDGWIEAEYINYSPIKPIVTIGWIRTDDLFTNAF